MMQRIVIPLLAGVFVMALAALMAWSLDRGEAFQRQVRLADTASRIEQRVSEQTSVLYAMRGMLLTSPDAGRVAFRDFLEAIQVDDRVPGMQGVGFALATPPNDTQPVRQLLQQRYGIDRAPWPDTTQTVRFPIVLLEPDDTRNRAALGFDMYSEPVRREAMDLAWVSNTPSATGRVTLVQETGDDVQAGFLIYLPLFRDGPDGTEIEGFVYAPFRTGDLLDTILAEAPGARLLAAFSDTVSDETRLYGEGLTFSQTRHIIEVGGREWILYLEPAAPPQVGLWRQASMIALVAGFLLAVLTAGFVRLAQSRFSAMEGLAAEREAREADKDVLLKEMNHRVKNLIARVSSIARMTVRSSDSLADFERSFMRRISALAAAQDMLMQSTWRRSTLDALVREELVELLETDAEQARFGGDEISINPLQAQALSLVVHELATNAIKYGAFAQEGRLEVSWSLDRSEDGLESVHLSWLEEGLSLPADLTREGFGTQLARMMIEDKLGGTFQRKAETTRLEVVITWPERAGWEG